MSPSNDKPYNKYRASRVRRPHVDEPPQPAAAPPAVEAPDAAAPRTARTGNGNGGAGGASRAARPAASRAAAAAPAAAPRTDEPVSIYRADRKADRGQAELRVVPEPEAGRRRRFRWRYLLVIPAVALVAFGIWAVLGYRVFDRAVIKSNHRLPRAAKVALVDRAAPILSTPTTTLVLGSDQRGQLPARSDTIMLLRVDPRTHTMSELSIPRDTLVDIPGHGQGKINEAYFWGGAALAIKVISRYTGVTVNHVMTVNFRGFPDLVDSVGGVVVNVPKNITSWYSGSTTVHFRKGPQLMDGKRALIYSRLRYVDNDFMRMGRQQQVVQALEKKLKRPGNFFRLPWIGADFMKGVHTDLSTKQIMELAYLQWRTPAAHQYKWVMPGTPQMINGGSYVIVDPTVKAKVVHRFLSK